MSTDDISLNVDENGVLTISGSRTERAKEEGITWHRRERAEGSFTRTIPVSPHSSLILALTLSSYLEMLTLPILLLSIKLGCS